MGDQEEDEGIPGTGGVISNDRADNNSYDNVSLSEFQRSLSKYYYSNNRHKRANNSSSSGVTSSTKQHSFQHSFHS